MTPGPEDQWRPPDPSGNRQPRPGGPGGQANPRPPSRPKWLPWVIVAMLVAIFLFWQTAPGSTPERAKITFGTFQDHVEAGKVAAIKYESSSGKITGKFVDGFNEDGKSEFTTQAQEGGLPDETFALLADKNVDLDYKPETTNWFQLIAVWVIPFALLGLIWWFIARRAQGQMGAVMNIGR
jgi:ATP-dependent Zn protease